MMDTPAKAAAPPDRTRIEELDVLRGIAAIAVLAYHYLVAFPVIFHGAPEPRVAFGVFAVHLFFMISGFVIFMTLARTRTALDFVVSRFSRLYPVFWVAVLVTWSIVAFAPLPGRAATPGEVLLNLTMLAEPLHAPYVDSVYWSLVIELVFYAIMLGAFLLGWLRRAERIVLPWLLLQLAAIGGAEVLHMKIPKIFAALFLLKYAHLFLAGILFYRLRFEGATRSRIALLACCLATQFAIQGVWAGIFATVFFTLFAALASQRLSWIAVRPLVFLGTISYSLYLVHQNIGYVILRALDGVPLPLAIAAACAAVISLAAALTFTVEKPALRLCRALYNRHRPLPRTVPMSQPSPLPPLATPPPTSSISAQ